ncbi:hypothetical protein Pst134EA_002973 [Puccinia striiformis f. sp. tritici]|uniref:Uncharacterized protein n=1 Tax=Puccinia striiformis f. sp. tritici PST-78 TaxID=1165861 RepID=A0A0L0W4G0_9BASI|nr:hypothetical protein Pst134EA_002973 [Puccinia striiformis f. sp. tritici]KAI9620524.1 hypothetical protein H4Q26_013737 [Puccinia striiformis f. sp. tritici PST-130]KNF06347.1 hypothetical protein PSTG_00233 [Puccinia striiformis f. sp. tritici PST-78]KAH9464517.1 hypothetical protein Pst134EB_004049 [Puccinia striiformis f. sp. tritici]KAH9472351.1 hypothetical protein Pst134EA_002973 [Puccinia striiformis f. sp. tritici]KAI9626452.1 hypothetical protein H4Q26_017825 [Puccinia striiformis
MNTFLFLIPFIIQYFATGMQRPRGGLASLGQESAIDNRDEILDFSSPPRMVELPPVDQVSIDMPTRKDVSAYNTMIREHTSPYEIPKPEERAMSTYPAGRDARDHPTSSDLAITRTRGEDDCLDSVYAKILCAAVLVGIVAGFIFFMVNVL